MPERVSTVSGEGDEPVPANATSAWRKLAALSGAVLLVFAMGLPLAVLGPASAAASNDAIHYVANSGFETIDASGSAAPRDGNPFSDANTLELPDVTLSAAGSADLTLDQRTGTQTKTSSIGGLGNADITVNPDDKQAIVIKSGLDSLDFADASYDASTSGADLTYDASSTGSITLKSTGLSEGTTVEAIDTADDSVLDSGDVTASGAVSFTALPSGTYDVKLEDTSTQGGGGGGSNSGSAPDDSTDETETPSGPADTGNTTDDETSDPTAQYTAGKNGTVVAGDRTNESTTRFQVSLATGDTEDSSAEIVLDLSGNRSSQAEETPAAQTAVGTDQPGTDTGQETAAESATPADSAPTTDGGQSTDGDSTGEGADGEDASDDSADNVVVDSLVIQRTSDATRDFEISVREWSVDSPRATTARTSGAQSSLSPPADAADISPLQLTPSTDPTVTTAPAPKAMGADWAGSTGGLAQQTSTKTPNPRQFLDETGAAAIGYLKVSHTLPDTEIENVTFQFRVKKAYLNDRAVGPGSVSVYRDEAAGWTEFDAEKIGENDRFYLYEATTPGLSLFTIGSTQPVIETQDASLRNSSVMTGEPAVVDATVRNFGSVDGTTTVTLTADGSTVGTTTVSVPGNSAETVTIRFSPDSAAEYELAVGGVDAGTLSVQTAESPAGEDDESGGPPVVIGGLIAALILGGTLVYIWRRQDGAEAAQKT
jgi:hypothetical protein